MFFCDFRNIKDSSGINEGTFQAVDKNNFPALEGMSINRISMKPGTLNPPHWHPHSHEIVYIIAGRALFGIRDTTKDEEGFDSDEAIFTAAAGEVVFIEQNYLHYFKSIGENDLELVVWLTSEHPAKISLLESLQGVPTAVAAQAFDVDEASLAGLTTVADTLLLPGTVNEDELESLGDQSYLPFKFDLKGYDYDPDDPAGIVQIVSHDVFPAMQDFTIARIVLYSGAMRQIHWHQFAAELNYVVAGQADFGIVTKNGDHYVETVSKDQIIMAPLGYPHYAKNMGSDNFEFILGFNNATIAGIDVRQCMQSLLPSIGTQALGVDITDFSTDSTTLVPTTNGS